MTSDLTEEEITNLTNTVINAYNVSDDDVTAEILYVTSGSLDLTISDETTEDEIVDAVTATLVKLLNVHPRDVTITSVDLTTGKITYEISSDSYTDAEVVQSSLDSLSNDTIEDSIQDSLPSAGVDGNDVDDNIDVDVSITVDGSDAGNIGEANNEITEELNNQGYDVDTDVTVVTAAPSVSPSFTTKVPSPAPSVTGIVVTLTLSSTTNILNATEVDNLESELANQYGVDIDEVTVEVTYTVSGSIDVDNVPDDVTNEQLEDILEQNIADALGVHSKDVDVTVDPTSGEVTYTVTTTDDVAATNVQETLETPAFLNDLNNEIMDDLPTANIATVDAEDDIVMDLVVIIDATDSNVNIEEANAQVIDDFEDQGVSGNSDSILKPTGFLKSLYKFRELSD